MENVNKFWSDVIKRNEDDLLFALGEACKDRIFKSSTGEEKSQEVNKIELRKHVKNKKVLK